MSGIQTLGSTIKNWIRNSAKQRNLRFTQNLCRVEYLDNIINSATGLFKDWWHFSGHQSLKGKKSSNLKWTDQAHPATQIYTQKNFFNQKKKFLILSAKKTIFQMKKVLRPVCCTNINSLNQTSLYPKNFFSIKEKISYTFTKTIPFKQKNISCLFERTYFLLKEKSLILKKKKNFNVKEKISYTFLKKTHALIRKNQIFQMKIISYNYWKNNEFLILAWKHIFLYKALHFRHALNTEAAILRWSLKILKIHRKTAASEFLF